MRRSEHPPVIQKPWIYRKSLEKWNNARNPCPTPTAVLRGPLGSGRFANSLDQDLLVPNFAGEPLRLADPRIPDSKVRYKDNRTSPLLFHTGKRNPLVWLAKPEAWPVRS